MGLKKRIGILGIGGVGGYFGGMLARHYFGSSFVEVVFIVKTPLASIIKSNGLSLFDNDTKYTIYPDFITSDPDEVGFLDYLICSVKSYDLEESLLSLKKSISPKTIILPLLNGVDAKDRVKNIYPENYVVDGCVYIVAKTLSPGTVQVLGSMKSLFFGSNSIPQELLLELKELLQVEGFTCYLSDSIEQVLWEKFVFVSSLATLTSYLNLTVGALLEDDNHLHFLKQLISEVVQVAACNSVYLPDVASITLEKIGSLPTAATTSMHNDFLKGGKTEFQSLTEYVVVSGLRFGIPTPYYNLVLSSYSNWRLGYLL